MAETLKPCPFCGNAPVVADDTSYGQCWAGCNCEHEPGVFRPIGETDALIEAWNRRAPADPHTQEETEA